MICLRCHKAIAICTLCRAFTGPYEGGHSWWRMNIPIIFDGDKKPKRTGPRNVLIKRANGELVVRPFRGLRLNPKEPTP